MRPPELFILLAVDKGGWRYDEYVVLHSCYLDDNASICIIHTRTHLHTHTYTHTHMWHTRIMLCIYGLEFKL